jgi:hypothetical protein
VNAQATTLYPFVPSGPSFPTALEFFAELGFATQWRQDGLAGLRFGGSHGPWSYRRTSGRVRNSK